MKNLYNLYKQNRSYLLRSFIMVGVFFSAFTTLFIFSTASQAKNMTASANLALKPAATTTPIVFPSTASYFNSLVLQAKAAYVYNITTGQIIYAKNENTVLPLASLTKVMTMLVADETVPKDTVVPITKTALALEGDNGLIANETWKLKDLMDFSLMVSSNDGAEAIAQTTAATINRQSGLTLPFTAYMNEEAKKIGMTKTTYTNASGLDINIKKGTAGAVGTAKDMATLLTYIVKNRPEVMETTRYPQRIFNSISGYQHIGSNTDLIINQVPNIIASKTGYTMLAGGNLSMVFDAGLNEPIVMVLLGSTQNGRFTDMLKLASSTQAYLLSTPSASSYAPATSSGSFQTNSIITR